MFSVLGRALCVTVAATSFFLNGAPVLAQERAPGFAINRFDPSERGSNWFVAESLDLRGDGRFAVGLVGDWAHRPLVVYDRDGNEISPLIQNQLHGHFGGSVIFWDRVRFALSFPVLLYQDGEGVTAGAVRFATDEGVNVGDLRLGADVRLYGDYRDPLTLAIGAQVHAPTGDRDAFTSDGTVRFSPRVLAAGEVGDFVYAARLGVNVRPEDAGFAGRATGHEVFTAMAVGARVSERLVVGPELFGSTVVSERDAVFSRQTTPFEVLFGSHYQLSDTLRVGIGIGPGLTRGYGAPAFRVVGGIEYFPEMPAEPANVVPDRDFDGIFDADDACPKEPGVRTDDPRTNGCPPRKDRDGDAIFDEHDACPEEPGVRTDDPQTNGCPLHKDADRDGIFDEQDACPKEPGLRTGDPRTNGCPPHKDTDRDGIFDEQDACSKVPGVRTDDAKTNGCPPPRDMDRDGIFDADDACPKQAGPPSDDPKANGCPLARIERNEIKIVEQVKFAYNSERIVAESEPILNAVLRILEEQPGIKKVEVHGHTDSQGADAYNLHLSQRRAESVIRWLTTHGIDKGRLAAKGFGETKPLDTNDSDAGRRNNRRVEFHIVKREKAKR